MSILIYLNVYAGTHARTRTRTKTQRIHTYKELLLIYRKNIDIDQKSSWIINPRSTFIDANPLIK